MASNTLFVSNFPFTTTEDELRSTFEAIGAIQSVRIIVDRETGRSRGFAFVEMATNADAEKAIKEMDGKEIKGRAIRVNEAQARERDGGGRSGGGGGGGGGGRKRW